MEKIKQHCGDMVETYDLLREVFFNSFKEDSIGAIKDKSSILDEKLKKEEFIKMLEDLNGDDLNEARWDYNALFVGPSRPKAIPYESPYRSDKDLLMREYAFQVREFYAQIGLEVEKINSFPDDYIGFEFQYLYCVSLLIANNNTGKEGDNKLDDEVIAELCNARKIFIEEHIITWVMDFCDDISKEATQEIWKKLSLFIRVVLDKEIVFYKDN